MGTLAVIVRKIYTSHTRRNSEGEWEEEIPIYYSYVYTVEYNVFTNDEEKIVKHFLSNDCRSYCEQNMKWHDEGYYFDAELSAILVQLLGIDRHSVVSPQEHLFYTLTDNNNYNSLPIYLQNIAQFPFVLPLSGKVIAKHYNEGYGVFTDDWGVIVPCKYQSCYYEAQTDVISMDYLYKLKDFTPNAIRVKLLNMFDWVEIYDNSIKVFIGRKQGLLRYDNKFIFECNYDAICDIKIGYLLCIDNKVGFFDKYGRCILPIDNQQIKCIDDKLRVTKGEYIGLYDVRNGWILSIEYDNIEFWGNGVYKVTKDWEYGLYDVNSMRWILPVEYSRIICFKDEIYEIVKGLKQGLYDKASKTIVIPPEYTSIEIDNNLIGSSLYVVSRDGYKGVIDINGKVIIPCQYEDVLSCNSSECIVAKASYKDFVLYRNGFRITRPYQMIHNFYNGVAIVNMGGYYKTTHNTGFSKTIFQGGKCGLINEFGKVVLLCNIYNRICYLFNGLYLAMFLDINKQERYLILNADGSIASIISLSINDAKYCGIPGAFTALNNGKYGVYTYNQKELIKNKYDEIDYFYDIDSETRLVARVKINNHYGYIDNLGRIVLPIVYRSLASSYNEYLQDQEYQDWREEQIEMERDSFYAMTEGNYGEYEGGTSWDSLTDFLGY